MFCLAVVPATLIAMPFQSAALGPAKTVAALPLLAAINACLVEFTLQDWQRLPFTATYAPSHTPAAMSFVLFITAFSIYGYACTAIAGQLILKPPG